MDPCAYIVERDSAGEPIGVCEKFEGDSVHQGQGADAHAYVPGQECDRCDGLGTLDIGLGEGVRAPLCPDCKGMGVVAA